MNATVEKENSAQAPNGAAAQGQAKRPFKTLRRGTLKAVIWENETRNGIMFSVQLIRSYRDDDAGEWKESHSLAGSDLLAASKLLSSADTLIHEEEQRRSEERQARQT